MPDLRTERRRRGWSLQNLGARTGISFADLSLIERGQRTLFPGWRKRLALAFGVPESSLYIDAPAPPVKPEQPIEARVSA